MLLRIENRFNRTFMELKFVVDGKSMKNIMV